MKGFAGFWRFIMKSLTYVLKITAIALNTYFSAWLLLFVCSGYGGHPLSLYAWLSSILICAVPPVTLITIALTFHKNLKILHSVLTIIAIILNAHLLESPLTAIPRYFFPNFLVILKKIRKKHQHSSLQQRHINRHL